MVNEINKVLEALGKEYCNSYPDCLNLRHCRFKMSCLLIKEQNINKDSVVIKNNNKETPNKPINVYFRKDAREYFANCGLVDQTMTLLKDYPFDLQICETWQELSEILNKNTHQLVVHSNMINNGVTLFEVLSMIETLLKISNKTNVPIAISIDKHTTLANIKEFQKTNIHGIVPSTDTFGLLEALKALEALYNRIPYWPKHIIDQLPGNTKSKKPNQIQLTTRQQEVLNLILERGISNKKIAKALNITESTVKIHVSAILKAYGVRTRTQLVVMSQK